MKLLAWIFAPLVLVISSGFADVAVFRVCGFYRNNDSTEIPNSLPPLNLLSKKEAYLTTLKFDQKERTDFVWKQTFENWTGPTAIDSFSLDLPGHTLTLERFQCALKKLPDTLCFNYTVSMDQIWSYSPISSPSPAKMLILSDSIGHIESNKFKSQDLRNGKKIEFQVNLSDLDKPEAEGPYLFHRTVKLNGLSHPPTFGMKEFRSTVRSRLPASARDNPLPYFDRILLDKLVIDINKLNPERQ